MAMTQTTGTHGQPGTQVSGARSIPTCCFEYQLEFTEEDSWDSADGIRQHTAMEGIFEITEDAATIPVGKSVSDDEPLYGATCDYQYGGVK